MADTVADAAGTAKKVDTGTDASGAVYTVDKGEETSDAAKTAGKAVDAAKKEDGFEVKGGTGGGTASEVDPIPELNTVVEGGTNTSWYKPDGSINYPPNNGAVPGADASKLALPPNTNPAIYQEFEVVKETPGTIQAEIARGVILQAVVYNMNFQSQYYN